MGFSKSKFDVAVRLNHIPIKAETWAAVIKKKQYTKFESKVFVCQRTGYILFIFNKIQDYLDIPRKVI